MTTVAGEAGGKVKMTLILCRMEYDVVLNVEGKTIAECDELARQLGQDEARDHSCLSTATHMRTVEDLPEDWRDSIPYGGKPGDNRTCREILNEKK